MQKCHYITIRNYSVSLPLIYGIFALLFSLLPMGAQSYIRISLEQSTDLQNWKSTSVAPEMIDSQGRIVVYTNDVLKRFRINLGATNLPNFNPWSESTTNIINRLRLEESVDLKSWQAVAITPAMIDINGRLVLPAATTNRFYRLQVGVFQPPGISAQPLSTTISSGSTATLSVTATGTAPLTYQWYQGAVGTTTTPVGTNSASFATPALTATTTYWVRITNGVGSVDSGLAGVTVVSIPADLAVVPAGSFQMGVTSGDTDSDAPSVSVTVGTFYMGKNEVTKALWDEVRTWAVSNGYTDLAAGAGKAINHPVHTISWWDVIKWCNARSQKEGLTPCYYQGAGGVMKTGTTAPTVNWSANGYRLPTEAEWEKAARGGVNGKRFPWGTDTISHSQANYYAIAIYGYDSSGSVKSYHPTYANGSWPYTSPVGAFAANGYGLNDMAGNVWEWCWDWYGATTYVNGATDPRGAASGSRRVIRGGSWSYYAHDCRVAYRGSSRPAISSDSSRFGFRVARSSVP